MKSWNELTGRLSKRARLTIEQLRAVAALIWVDASPFVKFRLVATLVLITLVAVLTALGPVALKMIVDGFDKPEQSLPISATLLIVLYVLSQWLARTIGELRGLVYARAERRMSRTLSERLFAHVMRLPLQYHLNRQTGGINQILQNGLQGYHVVLHTIIFTVLPVVVELATIVLVLGMFSQPVFLSLFCGAIACYAVAFSYAAMKITAAGRVASNAQIEANAVMTDGLLNYETVKYFAAESIIQDKVGRALLSVENNWVSFFRRFTLNGLAVAAIYASFLAATLLHAAGKVQDGSMTVGTFVLVNAYMLQVVRPVEMLGYATQNLSQGVAFLEKLMELFHERPEKMEATSSDSVGDTKQLGIARRARSDDSKPGPVSVELRDVQLSYGRRPPVLRGLSLQLPAGTSTGIVGVSGAGKSTLVRLLVRLVEPDSGTILFDGRPITELPLEELRRAVAVVPQDTVLFNDTIGYNIGFGRPGSTQQDVERAAKLAHLHDFIMRLPQRYDTPVGERGVKLSGGERQRVSIARAALKQPRIFIFDEATSSLDTATERDILTNLDEISRAMTTLIIAHRLSTVVHADQIVVMEEGAIIERGTHDSLLRTGGRYASLWKAQQEVVAA